MRDHALISYLRFIRRGNIDSNFTDDSIYHGSIYVYVHDYVHDYVSFL